MSGRQPRVSVIIPTYNAASYISEAIQSVLDQQYASIEIIVVDDGSTDDTQALLSKFENQILCLRQDHRGPSAARNRGLRVANGQYVCFLDADDFWLPNKLKTQVGVLESQSNVAMVCSDSRAIRGTETVTESALAGLHPPLQFDIPIANAFSRLLVSNFIIVSTVMVRKECLNEVGFFDESLPSVEDRDLFLRFSARFEISCLSSTLSVRRFHQSNLSSSRELALPARVRVFEKSRERFSDLAQPAVWAECLAVAYLQCGSLHYCNGHRLRAITMGLKSLWHAFVSGIPASPSSPRGFKYAQPSWMPLWFRSIMLLGASVVGFRTVQRLRHTLGGVLERAPFQLK